jgi:dihydrolipoamide dehydrogenase
MQKYDIAIIGGGPGGYVAAIRARQLGLSTVLIEREHLGGVCLNWGCIPTKSLLRSAEVYHLMKHADEFGLAVKDIKVDISKIVDRSRKIAGQLSKGVAGLLKKNKVDLIEGSASFENASTLKVKGKDGKDQTVTASHIIIATGARGRVLPGLEPDGKLVWTAREAMTPTELPKKLLVIGSGAIGIEFANFYATLGSDVTVVEVQERILNTEDAEISALAQKSFEKQGIKFLLKTTVNKLEHGKNNVTAHFSGATTDKATYDRVIVAVGIQGNVENLGLEKTKVTLEKGQIKINGYCETTQPGVYAIGDVAGAPWLAHKASHEGIICVEKIAKLSVHPIDNTMIPGCIYSMPQIASVGLTEAAAKAKGLDIKVGRFPYVANGKALAMGDAEGLIKTIFDAKTGELLGAHLIGAEVTELIQGYTIAKNLETTEAELMHTIFPHPTLSEAMHESVLNAYARTIHY